MKLNDKIKKGIAADRLAGMSVQECCEKWNVHRSTISKYFKKNETIQEVQIPMLPPDMEERAKFLSSDPPPMEQKEPHLDHPTIKEFMKKVLSEPVKEVVRVEEPVKEPVKELPRGDPNELIQRILLNAETFPDVFPNAPSQDTLASKSVLELDSVLKSMEHTRAVRMLSTQMKQVFFVASRATEVLGKAALRLKTDGMTDALMTQQKDLDYLFRELAIKHASKFSGTSEPEVRLLMMFGMTLLQTDATNRLKERLGTSATRVSEEYADL
jgi:hypothetical protein